MQSRGSMTDSMTAEAFYSRTLTVYGGFKNNPSHRVSLFIPSFFPLCINPDCFLRLILHDGITPAAVNHHPSLRFHWLTDTERCERLIIKSAGLNGLAVKIRKVIVSSRA